MAAVVSHAMRRFPTTSSDNSYSSCRYKGESSRPDGGESALSRSMRYADPWLYGSVRSPGALLLTPAFVLCACPDYVNGTKRSRKKSPTTCKKCKGTRIPVPQVEQSKFGTVRCYPTTIQNSTTTPLRAGTVRVTSSSRPSILPSTDPYNLMRKSRLSSESTSQFRARSVSPSQSRSGEKRTKGDKSDSYNSTLGRRSILECDINPYELVSYDPYNTKESNITMVNGQRIRVRPSQNDEEIEEKQRYEDVHLRLSTPSKSSTKNLKLVTKSIAKLASSTPATPKGKHKEIVNNLRSPKSKTPSPKIIENDFHLDRRRFKSILKKSSTYSDVESNGLSSSERSPSPVRRKGSQFYIPTPNSPNSIVKKKVKFMVEREVGFEVEEEENGRLGESSSDDSFSGDDEVFEETPKEIEEKKVEIKPTCKKTISLHRSLSDRIKKEESKVTFNDTMALRQLRHRKNLVVDFSDLERLDGLTSRSRKVSPRPSTPPPAPPIRNEVVVSDSNTGTYHEQVIEKVNCSEEVAQSTISGTHLEKISSMDETLLEKPSEKISLEKLDRCINGEVPVEPSPPSAPPRKRSNNKQPLLITNPLTTVHTVRIEAPTIENLNKTIVRINSPTAVHKLQIKNEFSENHVQSLSIMDNQQRKTSILINGDDCYSTVNVNDNIPIYQSSVVVNDTAIDVSPKKPKKCSTIYITGNFISPQVDAPIEEYYKNATKDEESDYIKSFNIESITKEKPVIESPDYDDIVSGFNEDHIPSSELLRELLKDPVEAVRRNLVPHICGKSDVSRRPRDKKNYSKLSNLPDKSSDMLSKSFPEDKGTKNSLEESFMRIRAYESICDDVSSEHSSSTQYELMDAGSECYTDHSNRSSVTEEELANRTKFYEMLAESGVAEVSENEDHLYECIKVNNDPIYEEIEIPPPLPSNPPPSNLIDDLNLDKEFTTRSIFEGASKYDILSYLVDAKERGIVQEDSYTYNFGNPTTTEEDIRVSQLSTVSDSSEDNSLIISGALIDDKAIFQKPAEVERNDSGVGSETSKSSLSKYRSKQELLFLCEDCESPLESKKENEPLLCRKCIKKRSERKEIITEIVETEEKYSRDLQIILEEFYQPMLVAGLLTPEQLSAIFLNVEELLENSQALAEKLRDAVEITIEQGDEDLLTVNMGKLFLEAMPMLHAFETYCIRQGSASLLLASLEKEKELLRIFLRVSQMENAMLRRMNLNSFLMVPVQRVTKYPLLLARLYKVTPPHMDNKEELKEAQHKIELHLNHMNSETKDVPSKLWRRIGSSSGRRSSAEMDLVNIKLRKIANDKIDPVNALLVINGKPSPNRTSERTEDNSLVFAKQGVREAALLLVRDKNGRYSLLRDPLYLDRCVIAADPAWQSYFEVQELMGKDTFIFKAEDEDQTHIWYKQLQYHAQGMGAWRKRRNALANIMINGMGLRS
ncbi:hypothetical protein JTB14_005338 [Gonioctena quinquepunctata]|nr:hypothetical protein JTB14_005338 [Gonioctena quinquepunctata]